MIDGSSLGGGFKDKDAGAEHALSAQESGMSLGEDEFVLAVKVAGTPSVYEADYEGLQAGQEVDLTTMPGAYETAAHFKIMLDRLTVGHAPLEGFEDASPPSKLFEGTVQSTDHYSVEPGSVVFGMFFPGEFAKIVDHSPSDGQTAAEIMAGRYWVEAGEPETW